MKIKMSVLRNKIANCFKNSQDLGLFAT